MGKDEACIDIKKLADSVRKMLKKVHPLPNSNLCCIYKVPLSMRRSHKSVYTPQIVSIGPFHHDNSNLQDMEEHKIRYLNHFLQRTNASIEDFLTLTKDKEADLRSCYAEFIELKKGKGKGNGKDFATIILVDALFLIELFLRDSEGELTNGIDDSIFRSGDLLLLENQLPLFILNDLFDLAKPAVSDKYNKGLPCNLFDISCRLRENPLGIEKETFRKHFPEAKHFLDLLRICFVPSNKPAPPRSCISLSKFVSPCCNGAKEQDDQHIPSAKELHQAGVKFKLAKSSKSLLDITFKENKRILAIPFLKVHGDTVRLYKNLLAFESRRGDTRYFNDYVILISYLVKTPKAAELLVENGIVGLGSDEKLTHVFHSLVKDCEHSTDNFHYVDLVKDLQGYCNCKYPWHKWNAYLKKRYFTTPWAFISFIAASILLVLTIMQTVCSFIAL